MATREENLKKINEQLEKLDDEQLEQIAGGRMMYIDDSDPKKESDVKIENQRLIIIG